MPLFKKSPKAFSLIEVMMGATVLVVGFVGLIEAVTVSSEMLDNARKQQIAVQVIDGEIEAVRAASWSTVTSLADGTTYTETIDSNGNATGNTWILNANPGLVATAKGFTVSVTSSYQRPAGATAGTVTFLMLTCSVTWTGNTGHVHTRSTDAYFGKYGLNLSDQKS